MADQLAKVEVEKTDAYDISIGGKRITVSERVAIELRDLLIRELGLPATRTEAERSTIVNTIRQAKAQREL